jgi:hypothetical protein
MTPERADDVSRMMMRGDAWTLAAQKSFPSRLLMRFRARTSPKLFLQKLRAAAHFLLTICVEVARLMSMRAVRRPLIAAG